MNGRKKIDKYFIYRWWDTKYRYLQASVPEADIKLVSVASKSCSSKPSSYLPTVKPSKMIWKKKDREWEMEIKKLLPLKSFSRIDIHYQMKVFHTPMYAIQAKDRTSMKVFYLYGFTRRWFNQLEYIFHIGCTRVYP